MLSDSQLVTSFQTYLLTEKRVSENTFLAYQADINQLLAYLAEKKLTLDKASKETLKRFLKTLKDQGLKARTLSRKISSLKLLYSFLHERHDLSNSALLLHFPKLEKNLPLYLTQEEIESLFKVANADKTLKGIRNKVMLSVLYASGMRISELLSLRTYQINFQTGFVHLMGKGSKERAVPLPQNILTLVRQYLDGPYTALLANCENTDTYLFFNVMKKKVKQLTRQAFWLLLKKLITKVGITKSISPHTLRHSLATHLLKNGANLRSLQMLLGHENVSTVEIYTHLEKSEVRTIYDDKHPRA